MMKKAIDEMELKDIPECVRYARLMALGTISSVYADNKDDEEISSDELRKVESSVCILEVCQRISSVSGGKL